MAIRASTDVGPVRGSVAPSTRARRTPAPARRVPVLKLPATRGPAGFALPRRADLPPPVIPRAGGSVQADAPPTDAPPGATDPTG